MKKPLVIDNGLYTNFACRLAQEIQVAYYSVWENAAPVARELAPGTGFRNIERVNNPLDFILSGHASAIYIPDLYLNGYAMLADEAEIPLFATREGNKLETDRWFLKDFLEKNGLAVIASVEITGIEELGDYLKTAEDKYVKVSLYRGNMETFHHLDWSQTSVWFDDLRARLGPIGRRIRFIVEDPIPDAYEVGIDGFFCDGELLEPFVYGPEIKDAGYVGIVCDSVAELPSGVQEVVTALSKYFGETRYRCFFSNEMRILKDGTVYMTDATCRVPSPPGGVLMAAITNFPELVESISVGKPVAPDFDGTKYLCEYVFRSDWVAEHWLEMDYAASFDHRVTLHNHCRIDGHTWVIPHDWQHTEIGSALGWAGTKEKAEAMARESAEAVKGYQLTWEKDVLETAEEELAKGQKLGFPE